MNFSLYFLNFISAFIGCFIIINRLFVNCIIGIY